MPRSPRTPKSTEIASYQHPQASSPQRPDVGTQAQFRKKFKPQPYRYDSSLAPELTWDSQNPAREQGEHALAELERSIATMRATLATQPDPELDAALRQAEEAARTLKALSRPFLNWTGKAERLSFKVPTLPLFVHERLSTEAILAAVRKGFALQGKLDFFGDERRSIADQVLRPYEAGPWRNRMVLGDSLVAMNALLHIEQLGGQVQMIYIDPPYGVKFGSNFQPFVRRRDVDHNDDEDMTREPEMVKAYRDTWELGLHSYLTYLRDRLLLARDLLHPSGSVFVQISDDNLHHVREIMDEVFGAENFVVIICYRRLGMMIGETLQSSAHYLIWYAKDKSIFKNYKIYEQQIAGLGTGDHYTQLEHGSTEQTRPMTPDERTNPRLISQEWKPFQLVSLTTGGFRPNTTINYEFEGKIYHPGPNKCWRTTKEGLDNLHSKGRIVKAGNTLRYKQFLDDFPLTEITTIWDDTARDRENHYVVQTPSNIIERCILMTTDPDDLVLDPTCGSGTTAYVAEQWGRRWITIDTSRVPLALARQRLLTATFPFYELKDEARGPAGGFVYRRKQNRKGEEIGGIVPHITLRSIANAEPPAEEVLVDRPEVVAGVTRVAGPFTFEATIPTPIDWERDGEEVGAAPATPAKGSFNERMLEVLRQSPVLHLPDGKVAAFKNIRPPAKSLSLSAEAVVENGEPRPVAFVFGPENGAVSEKLVFEAAREAYAKSYYHLYVIGFAIQPNARELIERSDAVVGVGATYVQATPDLMMGDLLKNMRSSQIFSVAGLPEIALHRTAEGAYQVELLGLDVFDPITMETDHRRGDDVPAWFLDSDYNGLAFHVSQAFFPRTSAWDGLKKALRGELNDSVWEHLAGTLSEPFSAGEEQRIAVKVIDDRGNELLVVRALEAAP